MPDQTTQKPVMLNKNTLVPIGVLVSCVVMALSGQSWLNDKFKQAEDHIDVKFEEQGLKLNDLERRLFSLEEAQKVRWNSLDMRRWILDLRSANPDLSIPDIKETENGYNN